ncbi:MULTISPECIES: hypothetical protein [Methylobacterium]|uniref:Glycoside hydrolase family 19 catalytic domain-containing protein n=1 Tax=Methylobacterium jeotgali TaxID=381630 RepID=A0ABQ4T1I0_9HYPH|nr:MULTISPECIES: hypothetical protein [Methylobacterium]PIU06892.1 MAG: hypothetical protein COT56_07095 [Methylobacterium sp. CG09_land_8_20_14_0_10_71_15]PIU16104.1 MAG: hypothetical protein COT28_01415 [Methylobacterium sp. CG08_land_8_20_14_0_20_71_15]GBU19363.1 hypothetical protein AwMethylo_35780 [Methylobacterium sp.]GJE08608.1 hypothetical protein AOPFMNJM_3951 [Methylobacterium jeotgali]
MAAALDRQAFFAAVRAKPFAGSLTQSQVNGMVALLDTCPVDLGTDAFAYCLATAFHETARTMLPVKEYGGAAYYQRMYDITGERPAKARELGNLTPGDGVLFCGRGYVQLTGRSNYRRATGELLNRGYLVRGQDLEINPDMAMAPDVAAAVMYLGMQEGWFTGKKLGDYFRAGLSDPTGARWIINRQDKAAAIASYFRDFQGALKAAGHRPGGVAASVPTPPVEAKPLAPPPYRNPGAVAAPASPKPVSPPAAEPSKPGFWASMLARLRGAYPPKKEN